MRQRKLFRAREGLSKVLKDVLKLLLNLHEVPLLRPNAHFVPTSLGRNAINNPVNCTQIMLRRRLLSFQQLGVKPALSPLLASSPQLP